MLQLQTQNSLSYLEPPAQERK